MTIYNNNFGVNRKKDGFADYNNTLPAQTLTANIETEILNNGVGGFTNLDYLPSGVTSLLDTTTGYLDLSELDLGDAIVVRKDLLFTPNSNGAKVKIIFEFGVGTGNEYTIEKDLPRLDSGGSISYRLIESEDFYVGNLLTKDNPVKMKIVSTVGGTLVNNGVSIIVNKRG